MGDRDSFKNTLLFPVAVFSRLIQDSLPITALYHLAYLYLQSLPTLSLLTPPHWGSHYEKKSGAQILLVSFIINSG